MREHQEHVSDDRHMQPSRKVGTRWLGLLVGFAWSVLGTTGLRGTGPFTDTSGGVERQLIDTSGGVEHVKLVWEASGAVLGPTETAGSSTLHVTGTSKTFGSRGAKVL